MPLLAPKCALWKATASVKVNAYISNIAMSEKRGAIQSRVAINKSQNLEFKLQVPWPCLLMKVIHQTKVKIISGLEWSIPAVDTPPWHQYCSSHHHTQYPTHYLYTSPLCPHLECYLQPVATDQFCMELQQ